MIASGVKARRKSVEDKDQLTGVGFHVSEVNEPKAMHIIQYTNDKILKNLDAVLEDLKIN